MTEHVTAATSPATFAGVTDLSDPQLLEKAKAKLGSYTEVARRLDVTKEYLSRVKAGLYSLSPITRSALLAILAGLPAPALPHGRARRGARSIDGIRIRLTSDEHDALWAASREWGVTFGEILVEALREYRPSAEGAAAPPPAARSREYRIGQQAVEAFAAKIGPRRMGAHARAAVLRKIKRVTGE